MSERSITVPEWSIASTKATVSIACHAPPGNRHQKSGPLVVGHLARGDAAHHKLNLVTSERMPLAFAADNIDGLPEKVTAHAPYTPSRVIRRRVKNKS